MIKESDKAYSELAFVTLSKVEHRRNSPSVVMPTSSGVGNTAHKDAFALLKE